MTTKKQQRSKTVAQASPAEAPAYHDGYVPQVDFGLSTQVFRKSDRLQAFLSGSTKSVGASCNVFSVGDSIGSIAEAAGWSLQVSAYQGAPSVDLSQLRPRNSAVNSGGESSGAASFSRVFDAVVGSMRRPTKKNGAGVVWLDATHADLEEFLAQDFSYAYKGVYVPSNASVDQMEALKANAPLLKQLATAYDYGQTFICKRPDTGLNGEPLYLNLCTEVEIPHRGTCTLGVINLSLFNEANFNTLPTVFAEAVLEMETNVNSTLQALPSTPLFCNSVNNKQFGLGVSGLASMLANNGLTYSSFTQMLNNALEDADTMHQAVDEAARLHFIYKDTLTLAVYNILSAYETATLSLGNRVTKAFCVQPSATGAYQCADSKGYYSSPELQPVIGIRDKSGVHTIRKSQLLGDEKVVFHPATETINDVPYTVYRRLCELWQRILDLTKLGHRHSGCWYGEKFSITDLEAFITSGQKSLYYRLPSYNEVALDKTQVGEGLEADFDLATLLTGATCKQVPGQIECDCTG